ncbi:MAG: 4Fe-4S binding protein [Firmicutes bacterium]|nr:4Fe-4S binding protein [Bacillota bacterium]
MRVITEECISCGACVDSCPVNCIHEGTPYTIDPNECIDCGACDPTCPVNAIIEK